MNRRARTGGIAFCVMRDPHSERLTLGALWVAAWVLFVALRLPYLSVPFERDEGGYGYIAQRTLLGELPYRDAYDQKPPLVFVPYMLAFATLGRTPLDVHVVLLLWNAGTLLCVAAIARWLGGRVAAAGAALVFAVASASPRLLGFTANTEMFMLLPMTASAWCALRGAASARQRSWWFAAGLLAGLACWFKPVAATSGLALAVYAVATARRDGGAAGERRLRALGRCAWLVVGALAATAPIVLYMAVHQGGLQAFFDGVARYNLAYVQSVSLDEGLRSLARSLGRQTPAFLPLWALAASALLLPGCRAAAAPVALWLVALAAGTAAGLHFREHYFIQVVPALAVLGGLALAALLARVEARPLPAAFGFVLLVAAPAVWADRALLWADSPAAISRAVYDVDPFPESEQIAREIATGSAPDETVLVLGSEPQILLYAQRRSATRFVFAHSLKLGLTGTPQRLAVAVAEVRAARPRFVLVERLPDSVLDAAAVPTPTWVDPEWEATGEHVLQTLYVWDPQAHAYYEFSRDSARALLESGAEKLRATAWLALYRRPD